MVALVCRKPPAAITFRRYASSVSAGRAAPARRRIGTKRRRLEYSQSGLKKRYKSLQGAVDAGWRFVDGDGVDVKPGKMSGPHFFIEPGGSVAMSSTTALHAINE